MAFILTPPLIARDETAFAILQAGDMDRPESLVISLAGWSPLQLLTHWRSEVGMLLSDSRDRCCVVSGLARSDNATVPSEWWKLYLVDDAAVLQYQVLRLNGREKWLDASRWWENISSYQTSASAAETGIAEWKVSRSELADWCNQCDVLLNAVKAVEND